MQIYTVSEFNQIINDYLEQGIGMVGVKGEVVDYKISREKLVFFELKDEKARVPCFMLIWELKQPIEDGMEIQVIGTPKLFTTSGRFHIRVSEIELVGEGALKRAFELTKAKLEKEGLFDAAHKKPIPRFPRTIGLITSKDGAVYHDVVRIINNRWRGLNILFAPVGVQGAAAIPEIVGALRYFNETTKADVLILGRGGGSLEDLQAFNSELVVRAIYSSRIPVVSGIGHEPDITLADLAADVRASTPSNAAEIVVPDRREVLWQMQSFENRIDFILESSISAYKDDIEQKMNLILRSFKWYGENIVRLSFELVSQFKNYFGRQQRNVFEQEKLLQTLSPVSTLKRGYSITFKQGAVVKSLENIAVDDIIRTRLSKGEFSSRII